MNQILGYFEKAVDGIAQYGAVQHFLVLFLAVLLFVWLSEKKEITEKQNRFLVYSLLMAVVLLIPVTAVAVMIYQTAFYDYEWSWSMVPVTAVIAFGIVLILDQKMSKKKTVVLTVIIAALLCLCGNQGCLQRVPEKESFIRMEIDKILEGVYEVTDDRSVVLWGPSDVMQTARRKDGNIKLIYGRDMWDEKAGAYDYEAYSSELTQAYVWMENAMRQYELALDSDDPEVTLGFLDEQYKWNQETGEYVEEIIKAGSDTIVLPTLIGDYIADCLTEVSDAHGKELKSVYAGEYSVYRFD
ncbi:MAG: hypothetical protein IKL22_10440 [Lachnospiraceae bacterium]|nr:hypothetical protein [Lachnospiraceae bacterium]